MHHVYVFYLCVKLTLFVYNHETDKVQLKQCSWVTKLTTFFVTHFPIPSIVVTLPPFTPHKGNRHWKEKKTTKKPCDHVTKINLIDTSIHTYIKNVTVVFN